MTNSIEKRNSGRTGPTTADGKASSAANSVKTGLFARTDRLLPGECPHEYEALVAGVFADLNPIGMCETSEVWAIIGLQLRRERCRRYECAALRFTSQKNRAKAKALLKPAFGPYPTIPSGETLVGLSALPALDALEKLHTAEATVSRQLDRSYARLHTLQIRRAENLKTNLGDVAAHPRIAPFIRD